MDKSEISVIDNIKMHYDELFAAEKKVASYIQKNMQEVIMLNVTELAHRSGASEATVVRTCKHLGYDGYYQMRLLISRDAGKYKAQSNENGKLTSSRQIFMNSSERIIHLAEFISTETLLKAGEILLNAEMIHIVSVGNTVTVVMDLGFRLERSGLRCTYAMLPEHYFNHISLGSNRDVVVAVTRSGASTQVIRAVELARKKDMKTIVITGELNKQLVEHADCVLHVVEKKQGNMIIKPDSHLLEMAINDALIYVIENYKAITNDYTNKETDSLTNDVDMLLSEYKL